MSMRKKLHRSIIALLVVLIALMPFGALADGLILDATTLTEEAEPLENVIIGEGGTEKNSDAMDEILTGNEGSLADGNEPFAGNDESLAENDAVVLYNEPAAPGDDSALSPEEGDADGEEIVSVVVEDEGKGVEASGLVIYPPAVFTQQLLQSWLFHPYLGSE